MVQEEHTVLIIVLCVLERDMMSEDVSVGGPSMAGGCSLCGGTGVVRSKCIYCGGSGRQEYAECTRCKMAKNVMISVLPNPFKRY